MMDFIEFEEMKSMEHLVRLKNNPVKYQISRYWENDYSHEDMYAYMKVLDNAVRIKHENTKSILIENIVLAQQRADYPKDLLARLSEYLKNIADVSEITPLFNHVMRQKQ
ncbi:MAG: hypothetical protein LBF37_00595 [Rickettsiales bacterium]|jgi:hypothetical protein|nr:hypothetical protein [Rickettsiales bacterium]